MSDLFFYTICVVVLIAYYLIMYVLIKAAFTILSMVLEFLIDFYFTHLDQYL